MSAQTPLLAERTAGAATWSRDRRYRYSLTRTWDEGPRLAWIMLNPSTADATHNDPTIRRCIGFARRWGYGGIEVVNLFALRTTDPRVLAQVLDPTGPGNDRALRRALRRNDAVVAAWGRHGRLHGRAAQVRRRLPAATLALGLTAHGEPAHPLFLPAVTEPATLLELTAGRRGAAGHLLGGPAR